MCVYVCMCVFTGSYVLMSRYFRLPLPCVESMYSRVFIVVFGDAFRE